MDECMAAVITGDVNDSSKLDPAHARVLERLLQDCFQAAATAFPEGGVKGFTSFRGDAWQFVVARPWLAPRVNLLFRSRLLELSHETFGRRLHSGAAIGFGCIDFLPDATSSAGGGTAYTLSGKRLDRLRRRLPGVGVAGLAELDGCLDALLGLIDALHRQWTPLQARAVSFALQGMTQRNIGAAWAPPISQQAVNKHLLAAGWPAVEPGLAWTETAIRGCIEKNNRPGA